MFDKDFSGNLGSIFQSFYDHFILRDLLAYIMPGSVMIMGTVLLWISPPEAFKYSVSLSFGQWLLGLAFAYGVGHACQSLGIRLGILRYSPERIFTEEWDKALDRYIKFDKLAVGTCARQRERENVLKLMYGNLAIAACIILVQHILNFLIAWPTVPTGVGMAIILVSLFLGHIEGWKTQARWEARVIAEEEDVSLFLVKSGADTKAKDHADKTPLHYAASGGYKDVARLIFEKGADINARDKNGKTPLMLALERERKEVTPSSQQKNR